MITCTNTLTDPYIFTSGSKDTRWLRKTYKDSGGQISVHTVCMSTMTTRIITEHEKNLLCHRCDSDVFDMA
jgi:hypothetical protein